MPYKYADLLFSYYYYIHCCNLPVWRCILYIWGQFKHLGIELIWMESSQGARDKETGQQRSRRAFRYSPVQSPAAKPISSRICKSPRSTAASLPGWWRHPCIFCLALQGLRQKQQRSWGKPAGEGPFVRKEYYYFPHHRLWNKHALSSPSLRVETRPWTTRTSPFYRENKGGGCFFCSSTIFLSTSAALIHLDWPIVPENRVRCLSPPPPPFLFSSPDHSFFTFCLLSRSGCKVAKMPSSLFADSSVHQGDALDDQRALQIALDQLTLLGLDNDENPLYDNNQEPRKKSVNMTECVPVPSSEHVAEIVGRQGVYLCFFESHLLLFIWYNHVMLLRSARTAKHPNTSGMSTSRAILCGRNRMPLHTVIGI